MSTTKFITTPQATLARKVPRALHALSIAFAALTAGSRAIPLGDNGALLRDLAARVRESTQAAP